MVQLEAIVGPHAVKLKRVMYRLGIQVLVCMLELKPIFKSIEPSIKNRGLYSIDEITENINFPFLEKI